MRDDGLTRAGFGPRACAYIIDRAIVFAALCLVRLPVMAASAFGTGRLTAGDFLFDHSVLDVVCWVLSAAYFAALTHFGGATLGKRVMRLRVCRPDGEPLRPVDVIYRETVGRFLSGILCVGYLLVLADGQKRAFHDILCDSCVVYDDVRLPRRETAPAADFGWSVPAGALPADGAPDTPVQEEPEDVC